MTAQPQNSTRRAGAGCARSALGSSSHGRRAALRRCVGGLVVGVFSLLLMCLSDLIDAHVLPLFFVARLAAKSGALPAGLS